MAFYIWSSYKAFFYSCFCCLGCWHWLYWIVFCSYFCCFGYLYWVCSPAMQIALPLQNNKNSSCTSKKTMLNSSVNVRPWWPRGQISNNCCNLAKIVLRPYPTEPAYHLLIMTKDNLELKSVFFRAAGPENSTAICNVLIFTLFRLYSECFQQN